ncbi:hypothetical protein M0654_03755 [Rhizobium sp. NTR19]|uniref:Uncharacterized protein n=1 Tax=Neorhizobium turbinariae TaxID=2937795 RepID=A0ABT0IMJ0_9HYPH|nr:hypothetical protein [Neorhizobium turbinariae]MCK8779095.1 hypothetical protein [Neorhizobium turbinariae]
MTRTLIGLDSTGVTCVKITKGSINPFTEPDTNYGSFLYNSKWFKDIKINNVYKLPTPSGTAYYPSGRNASNYNYAHYTDFNSWETIYRRGYFSSEYTFPAFDLKSKRRSDGRFVEISRRRFQGTSYNGNEAAYNRSDIPGIWYENLAGWGNPGTTIYNFFGAVGNALVLQGSYQNSGYDRHVVLWELPANNVAIKDSATKTPSPGQRVVQIDKDSCKVAKPGYDVRTATPTQLAMDSSRRPASVIKTGDVALAAGAVTEVPLGFAVGPNTVADIILYNGGVITFPAGQYFDALACEYWFSGSSMFIQNAEAACRARFIIMAFDDASPSSGTNKVLNKFTAGGQDVVQFLRPGSANPPNFSDVILDSRWPALQILDEGWIDVAPVSPGIYYPGSQIQGQLNQGQAVTKTFNNNGLFPFVKYWTYNQHSTQGWQINPALTFITESWNNKTRYHQGNSSYCYLTNNQATFVTFNGNPVLERTAGNPPQWVYDYQPDQVRGIRYYILGISV